MQNQKSLMLRWCWLAGGGSDIVYIIFAEKDGQCDQYVTIPMNSPGIIHFASLKIVHAPLTLIFMMRQQV